MNTIRITMIALAAMVLIACGQNDGEDVSRNEHKAPVIRVKTETISKLDHAPPVYTSGTVAAREEIRLSFKIGGVIHSIFVNEGAWVKKGQLLARLNPQEIKAQVNQAESALEKANRDLERASRLYEDTVVTLEVVQDLTTAKEVAASNLEIAKFNQQYAEIYAPASGRILKKFAESGEIIGPGSPVFYLAANNTEQVIRGSLTDVDIVRVNYGDPAEVFFDAWPADTFHAKVIEIAAGTDPMTGTFEIELQLMPHKKSLKNGFVGHIALSPQQNGDWMKIPMNALVEADNKSATFYAPGPEQTAQLITVQQYNIHNEFISVPAESLKGHSVIITDGARYIKSGDLISIVNQNPPAEENLAGN